MKRTITVWYDEKRKEVEIENDTLVVPEGVKRVYCYNNQLTELKLPEGLAWVYCSYNRLRELKLPEGIKRVYCYNNQLTEIKYYEGTDIYCDDGVTRTILPSSKGVK